MTKIRMDWKELLLTAEGHAGGGPKGQDIICAGISALMMALLNQLLLEEDQYETRWEKDDAKGMIRIHPKPPGIMEPRIRHYFQVIMTGLQAWAQAFPENIKIEEDGKDGAV